MNKLGFGFLRLPLKNDPGAKDYDWEIISQMVDLFMEGGGRYFDTCPTYLDGFSEEGIRRCVTERKPRKSFLLADKLPGYQCRSYEDCQRIFEKELKRCGADYFDVYLLHWLNRENYHLAEKYQEFRFLREKKDRGEAGKIGFSYHDSAKLLDEILSRHPEVDYVQLQINYIDWDAAGIEAARCYDTCVRHGKKIIVMEPVKGGTLAVLPKEAQECLQAVHPDWTPADWALRFVQSLPQVEICLSGMNTLKQVKDNIKEFEPLTQDEIQCLWKVRDVVERETAVPCTGCRYCVTYCPKHIPIPEYFKLFNEAFRYPEETWKIKPAYEQMAEKGGKASECISCKSCQRHCPQKIRISDFMREIAEKLE